MTLYIRVGNRTLTGEEAKRLTPDQIEKIKTDADKANQKRLENMRKGLGLEPQRITLDVTPKAVAARKAAIAVEEAKLAAETQKVTDELGSEAPSFVSEGESPKEVKKSKKKEVASA
jgi:hypothetical protein